MEEIFSRFPHLGEAIMDQLDNTDLTDGRLVDRVWRSFIDNQKLPWMRIIFKWTGHYNQEWHKISRKLNVEMVKILAKTVNLIDGEDIDPIDQTPLVIAAISGNTEIVAKLFKKEAFENYVDEQPYHIAAKHGKLEVCQFFIKNIDVKNPKDKQGVTPLHVAAEYGHFEICQMIMEAIDDKNPKNFDELGGSTPLHYAAEAVN